MEHGQHDKRGLRGRRGGLNLRSLNSKLERWPARPEPKFAFFEKKSNPRSRLKPPLKAKKLKKNHLASAARDTSRLSADRVSRTGAG